uniref:G-patch domain-containing protein n=1 Tax=Chromera velia CCMP2878 TaxID=1169474 RepID=A0A0G4EZS2_9ALVE|eukprot:Cvel_2555.t1-p1 / transcript=Cvel_2555.t1 / gene=Cvel_2555 / organism=Chromera_velia_CCMP2878 / gene_product=hypothetical protein / transcript_product=hypothetical protein / location=Cvel_scaffold101:26169-34088(+) / protein_length=217 / sequence_SO=supercontig / SO=protein_coding / is_pseudo=false
MSATALCEEEKALLRGRRPDGVNARPPCTFAEDAFKGMGFRWGGGLGKKADGIKTPYFFIRRTAEEETGMCKIPGEGIRYDVKLLQDKLARKEEAERSPTYHPQPLHQPPLQTPPKKRQRSLSEARCRASDGTLPTPFGEGAAAASANAVSATSSSELSARSLSGCRSTDDVSTASSASASTLLATPYRSTEAAASASSSLRSSMLSQTVAHSGCGM